MLAKVAQAARLSQAKIGAAQKVWRLAAAEAAWFVGAVGVVLRLSQFLSNRSLWLDEVLIALNVRERSLSDLLGPLSYHQAAPVGFTLLVKAVVTLFGENDYTYRLAPLVCGLAALPLIYIVARRLVGPNAALVALGLLALSDPAIYYAAELKPYSGDLFVALLLVAACPADLSQGLSVRRGLVLAAAGALAPLFSFPAVFVTAGMGLALAWACFRARSRRGLFVLAGVGTAWLVSFGAQYVLVVRPQAADQVLRDWWAGLGYYAPLPFTHPMWYFKAAFALFEDPGGMPLAGVGALAFLAGIALLVTRNPYGLTMLLAPVAAALLASALELYPFSARLLLFAAPALAIVAGAGAVSILRATRATAPLVGGITIGLLFLHPLYISAQHLLEPRTKEEAKLVLSYLQQHREPGDVVYLAEGSQYAYAFYADQYALAREPALVGASFDDWSVVASELEQLRGRPRTWVVFLHARSKGALDEPMTLRQLDLLGTRLDEFHAPGAAVYLYDLAGATGHAALATGGSAGGQPGARGSR